MEDRRTEGLYLELIDGPVDWYLKTRVAEVLGNPVVTRATWWRNEQRDRADLPRVLDEFDHLAVYETTRGFVPPDLLDERVRGLHFLATPRPGQGIITGRPTIGLSLVLISPRTDSDEQTLRDWGDFVHIRHIAEVAVPGYAMITPYINATECAHPRFMHFYEMDCDEPERAFQAMTPLVTQRIGQPDTVAWKRWATTPS